MAGERLKLWQAGEQLSAADLNSEFNNILSTADQNIGTPRSSAFDMNGQELILDVDDDTTLTADIDDRVDLRIGGVDCFQFLGTVGATVPPSITMAGSNTSLNVVPSGTGGLLVSGEEIGVLSGQIFGG